MTLLRSLVRSASENHARTVLTLVSASVAALAASSSSGSDTALHTSSHPEQYSQAQAPQNNQQIAVLATSASANRSLPEPFERADFDLYMEQPTREDLPRLVQAWHQGFEVWPWVWTQWNEYGPHVVFVGKLNEAVLGEIATLRQNHPHNSNILVVTTPDQLQGLPDDALHMCGIVTDATVALLNAEARILMLSDERIVCFDRLVVS